MDSKVYKIKNLEAMFNKLANAKGDKNVDAKGVHEYISNETGLKNE